jgi:1,4-dihydroxy-2-naphthoyl-CoA synthase
MTTPLLTAEKHDGVIARMDESVNVLMLTGAPPPRLEAAPEFFCAGADIEMLQKSAPYFKNEGAL